MLLLEIIVRPGRIRLDGGAWTIRSRAKNLVTLKIDWKGLRYPLGDTLIVGKYNGF